MTEPVVAGTPTPARIDWSMYLGSDFVVPILWSKDGVAVDLTAATVTVVFSAPPTGGRTPLALSTAGANAEGGTITVSTPGGGTNMVVRIPASATTTYEFNIIRYVMTVTYPGSGTLRWAEGDVAFTDGAATPG